MFAIRKLSLLLTGLCTLALAQNSLAQQTVRCDRVLNDQFQLQQAFDQAQPGSVVSISGTCEDVSLVIKVDGLTVQGPATLKGTGVAPVLRIQDVGDVNLVDLEVSGGATGVEVANARADAANVTAILPSSLDVQRPFASIRVINDCISISARGAGTLRTVCRG